MLLSASCGKNRATTMKLIKTDGEVGVENEKGKSVDLIDNLPYLTNVSDTRHRLNIHGGQKPIPWHGIILC